MSNYEIIISDGGSTDNTLKIVQQKNIKVVNSIKGRGIQLNTGAKAASGEILIFLHADTFLPSNAFEMIEEFFADPKNKICRFLLGFDFNQRLLDFFTKFSKYDTLFTRFGDSAIVIRKTFFDELNGFKDIEIFEDVDFLKRASRHNKIKVLNEAVITSSRRFIRNGIIRMQLTNIFLFIKYLFKAKSLLLSNMHSESLKKNVNDSIIIFLRYPKNKQVKRRLAKTTSSEFARIFYKACAENLIRTVKKITVVNLFAFYSDKNEKKEIIDWLGNKLFFAPQEGNDLGSRMKSAFEKVFSVGAEKVIIIGTDIPDLSKEIMQEAFKALDSNDIIIGPSKDGGYYLLGIKKMYSELFEGIEYGKPSVFDETLSVIIKLNLKCYKLQVLQDIDTEEDLISWLNNSSDNSMKKEINLAYKTA